MRLISMAKTWFAIQARTKMVTRRAECSREHAGAPFRWRPTWANLKRGDLLRTVEWSPRAGELPACEVHGKSAHWYCPICARPGCRLCPGDCREAILP